MKTLLLLLMALPLSAANRYFVNGGVDNNWGTTGNWSLTDGGAGGQSVPTAADAVFFTSNSPNCTVNASNRLAGSLTFTGYTNTLTMTFNISVGASGTPADVTLSSGMTITGSGMLGLQNTGTLTSNGKTWPTPLSFNGSSQTYTLADNWQVSGTLAMAVVSFTLNGFQLSHSGSMTIGNGTVTGTTTLVTNGTGTITSTQTTGRISIPWTINSAGTVTFAAGTLYFGNSTFTYTAGTISGASGVTLNLTSSGTTTLALNGITWGAIVIPSSQTYTLNEDLNTSGLLSLGGTVATPVINGHNINTAGGLRYAGTSGFVSGTTVIKLTGSGSVDAPSWTSGRVTNPITIAAGVGTITVSSAFLIDFGKLTFTSGTVVTNNTWAASSSSGPQAYTFQ